MLILVLAANTAYADFPRLASLLARDDYAPHQLAFRGDRLAFSNGIVPARRPQRAADRRVRRLDRGAAAALRPERLRRVHLLAGGHGRALAARARADAGGSRRSSTASARSSPALVALIAAGTNFMDADLPIIPGTADRLGLLAGARDRAGLHLDVPQGPPPLRGGRPDDASCRRAADRPAAQERGRRADRAAEPPGLPGAAVRARRSRRTSWRSTSPRTRRRPTRSRTPGQDWGAGRAADDHRVAVPQPDPAAAALPGAS